MRVLNDFKCEVCSFTKEIFEDVNTRIVRCKECDGDAHKIIGNCNFALDPISGHFPGATDKWARHHEKMANKGSDSN